ncbi:hypothetical protein [Mucilaginibacter terrae]|uniref:Magnesium-transporting ATPase (P-type) n=1 Tax=Mucilaginibacter terrae TaxID=1955052 RepID=A0ABU3GWB0_9SPHI|nr:hypothetical protein [Mucilaginibacter terrae]MDT3404054.1 magnesium-transporting ATPase (P-type) [Mucilaginibacter terrae]
MIKKSYVLAELLWVVAVLLFCWGFAIWLTPATGLFNLDIEVTVYTIPFIVKGFGLIVFPFMLLGIVIYYVKESFYSYRRFLPNTILLCFNFLLLLLIISVPLLISYFFNFKEQGITIYPPLSALPKANSAEMLLVNLAKAGYILYGILIGLMISLVISALLTRRAWSYLPLHQ